MTGREFPRNKGGLKCLCARRRDLGVLLVCRRWYEEAGRVFYGGNTFGFEDVGVLVEFVRNLVGRWRGVVGRVSLMGGVSEPADAGAGVVTSGLEERGSGAMSSNQLARVRSALRQLPALTYLELDASFLTHVKNVRAMLRLGLRGVRQVSFTAPNGKHTYSTANGNPYIWPQYHDPILLVGGLAEEVARAIKGQRCAWLKRTGAVEKAVERERVVQKGIEHSPVGPGGVVEGTDDIEWSRLFWESGGGHRSAYLHSPSQQRQVGHWRTWVSSHAAATPTLGVEDEVLEMYEIEVSRNK